MARKAYSCRLTRLKRMPEQWQCSDSVTPGTQPEGMPDNGGVPRCKNLAPSSILAPGPHRGCGQISLPSLILKDLG